MENLENFIAVTGIILAVAGTAMTIRGFYAIHIRKDKSIHWSK